MLDRYPLLLPLLALIGGILIGGFISLPLSIVWVLVFINAVLLVVLLAFHKLRSPFYFTLMALLMGVNLTLWQDHRLYKNHFAKNFPTQAQTYSGRIVDYGQQTKKAFRFEVALSSVGMEKIQGSIYLYLPKSDSLLSVLPGDDIQFRAQLNGIDEPKNPHEFDYQNYLHLHQIFAQAYTQEYLIHKRNDAISVKRYSAQTRKKLLDVLYSLNLNDEERSIAAALLLGYRSLITDETAQAFAGAGAMHVLAVSGLHVGILYWITAMLLGIDRKKPHRNAWHRVLATVVIIWAYALLTGLSPSVTRAAVMFTFIAIGGLSERQSNSLQAIMASAILLLAIKPYYLFEVGFQLSYAAVIGIIYIQPKLYYLIAKPKYWLLDKAWQIVTVSIAAQLGTFPLSIYYFHQFPVLFIISNLIVIPLVFITMYTGLFVIILGSIFNFAWLGWPLKALLYVMIESVAWVEKLPYAVAHQLWVSRLELVFWYIIVFATIHAIWLRGKRTFALAIISCIALILLDIVDIYKQSDQEQLIFYSIKGKTAIEYRKGHEAIIVADQSTLTNKDAMLFHIRHNQWAGGLYTIEEKNRTIRKRAKQEVHPIIAFGNQKVLFYRFKTDSTYFKLKPQFVVIERNIEPPKNLPQSALPILMSGLNEKTCASWEIKFEPAHNLNAQGALQVNL